MTSRRAHLKFLIKIFLIFPRQNELKRNTSKTLEGVLHTPSQNKKHIFSRQIHALKEMRRYSLSKSEQKITCVNHCQTQTLKNKAIALFAIQHKRAT